MSNHRFGQDSAQTSYSSRRILTHQNQDESREANEKLNKVKNNNHQMKLQQSLIQALDQNDVLRQQTKRLTLKNYELQALLSEATQQIQQKNKIIKQCASNLWVRENIAVLKSQSNHDAGGLPRRVKRYVSQ